MADSPREEADVVIANLQRGGEVGSDYTEVMAQRSEPTLAGDEAPGLPDHVRPGLRVLFVGINPGMRSAALGHHFAGHSNRFWRLLHESRLVPEPLGFADDARLLDFGYGITNLVARPTPGVADLRTEELAAGSRILRRKVAQSKPEIVALVGVLVWRVVAGVDPKERARLGMQAERLHASRVFVLPNPSGRNAHYTYADMLEAFAGLRRHLERSRARPRASRSGPPGARASRRRSPRS